MEPLTKAHLHRLGILAAADRENLFTRLPYRSFHRSRALCVALCQGGALHWVNDKNGVKDLDVYTFYAAGGGPPYPPRRTATVDYLDSGLTGWCERVICWAAQSRTSRAAIQLKACWPTFVSQELAQHRSLRKKQWC